jgi:hypothetical protein
MQRPGGRPQGSRRASRTVGQEAHRDRRVTPIHSLQGNQSDCCPAGGQLISATAKHAHGDPLGERQERVEIVLRERITELGEFLAAKVDGAQSCRRDEVIGPRLNEAKQVVLTCREFVTHAHKRRRPMTRLLVPLLGGSSRRHRSPNHDGLSPAPA